MISIILDLIKEKGSYNSNFAISLMNNSPTYRDHIFDVVELPDVIASSEVKHIEDGTNFLMIRPNPATDKVYIEFMHNSAIRKIKSSCLMSAENWLQTITINCYTGGIELDIRNLREGFYFVIADRCEAQEL